MDTNYELDSREIETLQMLQVLLGLEKATIYVAGMDTPTRTRFTRLVKNGFISVAPKSLEYVILLNVTMTPTITTEALV